MTTVDVVAAVVESGGRFLVTRRQAGVHLAGLWEFPGGKVGEAKRTRARCGARCVEELDVDVAVGGLVLRRRTPIATAL